MIEPGGSRQSDGGGFEGSGNARIIESIELPNHFDLSDEVRQDLAVKGGRKPERWVVVEVEEAYIHCSKHIPLLKKLDKTIRWGTDDEIHKGGDYFKVRSSRRASDISASQRNTQ